MRGFESIIQLIKILTVVDVAERIGVKPETILKWRSKGKCPIPFEKLYGRLDILACDYDQFCSTRKGKKFLNQVKRNTKGRHGSSRDKYNLSDTSSVAKQCTEECSIDFRPLSHPSALTNRSSMSVLRSANELLENYFSDKSTKSFIDKLAVTGRVSETGICKLMNILPQREVNKRKYELSFGHSLRCSYAYKRIRHYDRSFKIHFGKSYFYLSLKTGKSKKSNFRIEFNPAKCNREELESFLEVIKQTIGEKYFDGFKRSLRVSRIDVALDLSNVPINSVLTWSGKSIVRTFSYSATPTEGRANGSFVSSRYMGSVNSSQFKVYNKAVEENEKRTACNRDFKTRLEWKIKPNVDSKIKNTTRPTLDSFRLYSKYFLSTRFYSMEILKSLSKNSKVIILNDGLDLYLSLKTEKQRRKLLEKWKEFQIELPYIRIRNQLMKELNDIRTAFQLPRLHVPKRIKKAQ